MYRRGWEDMDKRCENEEHIEKALEPLKGHLPSATELDLLEVFFKAIADPTRLKILALISKERLCVCDIAVIIDMSQSAVSHQLRVLKQANLIVKEKVGKQVFYQLSDHHVTRIIEQSIEHINENI